MRVKDFELREDTSDLHSERILLTAVLKMVYFQIEWWGWRAGSEARRPVRGVVIIPA